MCLSDDGIDEHQETAILNVQNIVSFQISRSQRTLCWTWPPPAAPARQRPTSWKQCFPAAPPHAAACSICTSDPRGLSKHVCNSGSGRQQLSYRSRLCVWGGEWQMHCGRYILGVKHMCSIWRWCRGLALICSPASRGEPVQSLCPAPGPPPRSRRPPKGLLEWMSQ